MYISRGRGFESNIRFALYYSFILFAFEYIAYTKYKVPKVIFGINLRVNPYQFSLKL